MDEKLETIQQTQPEQTVEQSTPPVKSSNFLIILLSILLVLALSSTAYFAFQTQKLVNELNSTSAPTIVPTTEPVPTDDPTADWKTYINPNGAYRYKYPTNWEAETSKSGEDETAGSLFGPQVFEYPGFGGVEVRQYLTGDVSKHINELIAGGVITLVGQEVIKVGNLTGLRVKYTGSPISGTSVYLQKDRHIYNIYLNSWDEDDIMIYDHILSTFKFLD